MPVPDLHIISFAVPYPPVYGGAIDSWHRLRELKAAGVRVTLHCFLYHAFKPQPILETVAQEVHYYPRVIWPVVLTRDQPYIVSSRKSPALLQRLRADHQPVLCEGIQTTGFAKECPGKTWLLRAHNVEHQYYRELADRGKGIKTLIYRREAQCLESYERESVSLFKAVFSISPKDHQWFTDQKAQSVLVPPFHGFEQPDMPLGRGAYVLFHGDLSLEVNQQAVLDMMRHLPAEHAYPVLIAGRKGNRIFEEKLSRMPNLRREADVSEETMTTLIRNAHIILIHSLHDAGMKMKIFPALYHGRFVAASENIRTGTVLDEALQFYNPYELAANVDRLWPMEFTTTMVSERTAILKRHPDDKAQTTEIIRYL